MCYVLRVMCHLSFVMCHVSCVMCHVSCVMRHVSCVMRYALRVMCYVLRVMCYVLCVNAHSVHITLEELKHVTLRRSFKIRVGGPLDQGNHLIIVRSSFLKSSVFKIFRSIRKRKLAFSNRSDFKSVMAGKSHDCRDTVFKVFFVLTQTKTGASSGLN